ncbi:hypothetical protein PSTT_07573 [Puccinia striiformis]|uniref:Uncharacterized protein n=1 Tax=Puccinia striiformis TaxID=27350 RepID=A0A2S4VFM1_9BASI|nr:hypothetical protein PSTT_07573 [Puccinia striiformis]
MTLYQYVNHPENHQDMIREGTQEEDNNKKIYHQEGCDVPAVEEGIDGLKRALLPSLDKALIRLHESVPWSSRGPGSVLDMNTTIKEIGNLIDQIEDVILFPAQSLATKSSRVERDGLRKFRIEEIRDQTIGVIEHLSDAFKALLCVLGIKDHVDDDDGEKDEWREMNDRARYKVSFLITFVDRSHISIVQSRWDTMASDLDKTLLRLAHNLSSKTSSTDSKSHSINAAMSIVKLARTFFRKLTSQEYHNFLQSRLISCLDHHLFIIDLLDLLLPSTYILLNSITQIDLIIINHHLHKDNQIRLTESIHLSKQAFVQPINLLILQGFSSIPYLDLKQWFLDFKGYINLAFKILSTSCIHFSN